MSRRNIYFVAAKCNAVAHALPSISAGENDRSCITTCFQCTMAKGEVFPIGSQNVTCCLILVLD